MSEPRYPYVHVDVEAEQADEISALLFELGAEGVEERDQGTLAKASASDVTTLVASFASSADAHEAVAALHDTHPGLAPRYEEVVGDAWRDAWKEHFRPFSIAPSLVVRPPWESYQPKPGERVLELEPGRAFGTGLHETTRLVATALTRYASEVTGADVLDVGCGSGILSLVALTLGASRAIAIDVDPEAIAVTLENAARNDLSGRVEASTTPLPSLAEAAPIVLANIEARVLIPMARALVAHVATGGLLLLSGILVPQKDEVRAAYEGLELLDAPSLGEWVLLALRKG